MCFCRSSNEVSPGNPAGFDVLGCLAAPSQHAAADKTIQRQSAEQSASRGALASSQKCVHAAHGRSRAEAAEAARQVYSKI